MSEEILKALMQLFAIISKQDDGTTADQRDFVESFLSSQLNSQKVQEYLKLYDEKSQDSDPGATENPQPGGKLTSVKDSVRTLAICRKINKTLTQKQKVIVLIRLLEMLKAENLYTDQRMGIIRTVANVFNISNEELELISNYIRYDETGRMNSGEILIVNSQNPEVITGDQKHITSPGLDGDIFIIRVKSADLYFIRYQGMSEIFLNGMPFNNRKVYVFPGGSNLRVPRGTIYYNDIISRFLNSGSTNRLSFKAENISFEFSNGVKGLRNINIAEEFGLIGIMGASGSGKTTLLNILSGIETPSEGSVLLNGINVHSKAVEAKRMIGYIAQDDFLIEDLNVFENLFYNAKMCFKDKSEEEIKTLTERTLENLGLFEIKDIKVGSPMNKKISGGQRKRLNIALELIREPSVLFVDEPTSGLSSRDSENVMDLLKELTLQMKLIFVVIHQPSSDIFKMFDKLVILDTGGYQIYYGNPVEGVMYFKHATRQINAEVGECHSCGNVNPEVLFNIIESKEVDDFGRHTRQRIKTPSEWNELFLQTHKPVDIETVNTIPPRSFHIQDRINQLGIFIKRDILSKISNLQYVLITLLEAPLMALFLTVIIKYIPDGKAQYIFRENENLPPYIFMSIVIALFIGLSVSAEEIFRDRKILRRERFLELSRSSYLLSKVIILFSLSAVQMITFVLIGNSLMGIKGLTFEYWAILFSVACFANILGLNISSSFNSAVTIYILIPLLVIPQMALGGAMFNFDKINKVFGGTKGNSPVIADVMASRWAYEALAVTQFTGNRYERELFELEKLQSMSNYKQVYYIPELQKIIEESTALVNEGTLAGKTTLSSNLVILKNEFESEMNYFRNLSPFQTSLFTVENYTQEVAGKALEYLKVLNNKYIDLYNIVGSKKDERIMELQGSGKSQFVHAYDSYYNDCLADIVRKVTVKSKIIRGKDRLIQNLDPIFFLPVGNPTLSFRAHFFAPAKYIFSYPVSTLAFNIMVIWVMSLIFYLALYFDILKRLIERITKKYEGGKSY